MSFSVTWHLLLFSLPSSFRIVAYPGEGGEELSVLKGGELGVRVLAVLSEGLIGVDRPGQKTEGGSFFFFFFFGGGGGDACKVVLFAE